MPKYKGKFVMIDGIDGSGKGTLVLALAEWAKKKGLKILNLREYGKKYHSLPEPEELKSYQVIVSSEPTFSLIGRAIRDEIVRHNKREYSALSTAQAFALDRYILYKRVIIPALLQGKYVFQERGVTTSVCYQPIQKESLSLKKILDLEGNRLTLQYRPDLLIITVLKPEIAMQRLQNRDGKKDGAIFERLSFLRKAQKRFVSKWFRKMFERYGAKIFYVETTGAKEKNAKKVIQIWEKFLK